MITLEDAQDCANFACGENAPDLAKMNADNVLEMRKHFLLNVAYNGKRSHAHIIDVLRYMTKFMD